MANRARLIVPFFKRKEWDEAIEAKRQADKFMRDTLDDIRQEKLYNATREELKDLGLIQGHRSDADA